VSVREQPIDGLSELHITIRYATRVMTREAEVDAVPHVGELWVVIRFLGLQRDAG
jgi:hypothetical protein